MSLLNVQLPPPPAHISSPCEIRVISTQEEFEAVARLRYEVFVLELGLDVPGADHERRIVTGGLDKGPILGEFAPDGHLVRTYEVYRTL